MYKDLPSANRLSPAVTLTGVKSVISSLESSPSLSPAKYIMSIHYVNTLRQVAVDEFIYKYK